MKTVAITQRVAVDSRNTASAAIAWIKRGPDSCSLRAVAAADAERRRRGARAVRGRGSRRPGADGRQRPLAARRRCAGTRRHRKRAPRRGRVARPAGTRRVPRHADDPAALRRRAAARRGTCHAAAAIAIDGEPTEVNSYHCFGAYDSRPPLDIWAVRRDGVVKAVRHASRRTTGIMWHPERNSPFAADDIALFRNVFEAA